MVVTCKRVNGKGDTGRAGRRDVDLKEERSRGLDLRQQRDCHATPRIKVTIDDPSLVPAQIGQLHSNDLQNPIVIRFHHSSSETSARAELFMPCIYSIIILLL